MTYRFGRLLAATCIAGAALWPLAASAKDCKALVAKQDSLISQYEALHKKQTAIPEAHSCDAPALGLIKAQMKKMDQIIAVQKQIVGCNDTNKKAHTINAGKRGDLNVALNACGLENELKKRYPS